MFSSCKEGLTFCTISTEAFWVKVGVWLVCPCVVWMDTNGHNNHLCNLLDLPLTNHFHILSWNEGANNANNRNIVLRNCARCWNKQPDYTFQKKNLISQFCGENTTLYSHLCSGDWHVRIGTDHICQRISDWFFFFFIVTIWFVLYFCDIKDATWIFNNSIFCLLDKHAL